VTLSRQNLTGLRPGSAPGSETAALDDLHLEVIKAQKLVGEIDSSIEAAHGKDVDRILIYIFRDDKRMQLLTDDQEALRARRLELLKTTLPDNSRVKDLEKQIEAKQQAMLQRAQELAAAAHASKEALEKEYRQKLNEVNSEAPNSSAGLSLLNVEAKVATLQAQIQEIEKMTHDQKAIYVQQNFPNPTLTTLMQELDLAQQDLIKLKTDYAPDHPKYKSAEETVDDLKRKCDAQVNGTVDGLRSKLVVEQAQLEVLRRNQSAGGSATTSSNPIVVEQLRQLAWVKRLQAMPLNSVRQIAPTVLTDATLINLIYQYNQAELDLIRLRTDHTEEHPDIQKQKAIEAALQDKIKERLVGMGEALSMETANSAPTSGGANVQTHEPATTDEEQQEIRRIQLMIQNSPDLINAPAGEGIRPTPLITAAMKGQLVVAKYLLDHGADVNGFSGNHGYVPLIAAAENGHKAMVELLLARGADVSGRGLNPFYLAVSKGYLGVAEVLLANKADVNAPSGTDGNRMRPVHVAARDGRMDLLQLLIQHGADVNASAPGWTPLGLAANSDNTNAVKILLDAKADIEAKNGNGNTALHEAAKTDDAGLISLLLQAGATVDATNREDTTPLMLAVTGNRTNAVRVLLEHKANPNRPGVGSRNFPPSRSTNALPVMFAIWSGYDDVLKLLLDAGANPEAGSPYAEPLFDAINNYHVGAVQLLLDHGANPNIRNREGHSPLSFAAERYRPAPIISALLEKGADPNERDSDGGTPLFHVQHVEVVRLLIEHKADVNATLADGKTPLMTIADTNIMALLLDSGAKMDLQDSNGDTALHHMVDRPAANAVAILLEHKANPNVQNNSGLTPLDLAKNWEPVPGTMVMGMPGIDRVGDGKKIAALLVKAGGLANLPKRDRIEVRRASTAGVAFTKGSHDWNRYSLLEMIAAQYTFLNQKGAGVWDRNGSARSIMWDRNFPFPDFKNVIIYRRTDLSAKQKAIYVDVESVLGSGDCSKDILLEWGDVVEIPEADHPIDQHWSGLTDGTITALTNCTARQIVIVINGVSTPVRLSPQFAPQYPTQMAGQTDSAMLMAHVSFMLRSVLDNSKLVRVSSDLSRVKVTRVDAQTKKKLEWVVDCTKPEQADLWLRDGDVIDVPEK
jgi:ankyrin repeat protein